LDYKHKYFIDIDCVIIAASLELKKVRNVLLFGFGCDRVLNFCLGLVKQENGAQRGASWLECLNTLIFLLRKSTILLGVRMDKDDLMFFTQGFPLRSVRDLKLKISKLCENCSFYFSVEPTIDNQFSRKVFTSSVFSISLYKNKSSPIQIFD